MPSSSKHLIQILSLLLLSHAGMANAETKTSTSFKMPEDGGLLPRAPIPEGGVEDGIHRADTPQGGVDDGMKRADMPGVTPPPKEGAKGATKQEPHGHPHGHPGGHGPDKLPPKHPCEGCEGQKEQVALTWGGYLRAMAEVIENDPQATYIGRNDGFKLANARMKLGASYKSLSAVLSIEAAVGDRESFNDPNAEFVVRPRDAYLSYAFSDFASIHIGRFEAPYDIGELASTRKRFFIEEPLETRGVLPTQGNEVVGMSQERQLGVMLAQKRLGLTKEGFDLGYALALTNGRTFNLALNDNDRPAGFVRISAFYGPWVELNVGGFTDTRTVGELPNLFDEEVKGTEISMVLSIEGLRVEGQFLFQNTIFKTIGREEVNAIGAHGEFSYRIWNVEAGYRFAYYDPNTKDLDDKDAVNEHTVGLAYLVEDVDLKFAINGTVSNEQAGRKVDNNRITLLSQFAF